MRKFIFIFIIILGFGIIGTGIFLQIDSNEETKSKENKIEDTNEKETLTFEPINKYNLPEICSKENQVSTYINTTNYSKISFNYPNCVHEYSLTFYTKILSDENYDTNINVSIERKTSNTYMNEKKVYIIALKNEHNYEVHYTDVKEITTKNNYKASIIQANYQSSYTFSTYRYDLWYIAIELEEELILTFEISSDDNVINYEAIEAMINSVKLEENAATFKHSIIDGEYQTGTIQENLYKSYEHGYKINYKVPTKYPEIDSLGTNINSAIFAYEELTKKMYVQMSVENDSYDNFEDQVATWKEIAISSYNSDPERYRNIQDTGLIEKTINDKKFYYFIYTYDYYLNNQKTNTNYISKVFYEIEPQIYVELWISNKEVLVDETFISDFLNFTVEEY